MAFGDVLKANIWKLKNASENKLAIDAFWIILRDIVVKEILSIHPSKVDSDIAIGIYYDILCDNLNFIPVYFQEKLHSNKQERFRVINRNVWSSNAFHTDGLANQPKIHAYKEINPNKKGERIIYQGVL